MGSALVRTLPHPALRPYISDYHGFRERTDVPMRRREMPFGRVAVILSFEGGWILEQPREGTVLHRRSFVGGIIDHYTVSEHDGFAHAMQMDLTPLGVARLLGVPAGAVARQVPEFEDVVGPWGAELVDRLAHGATWPERFRILDAALLRRLTDAEPSRPDVEWAHRRLVSARGRLDVKTLTTELRCSRRHLSQQFNEQVGCSPKAFGRLLRFEHALEHLRMPEPEPLGEIALACGYYDHAHFTREFAGYAGGPPTDYLRRILDDGNRSVTAD